MSFISSTFVWFFITVFCLYWFCLGKHRRAQNLLLLCSSYYFYGCWDPRFLLLVLNNSIVDYIVALKMSAPGWENRRRLLMGISLLSNLGVLLFFKYFNFFVLQFQSLLESQGIHAEYRHLAIVLPVGISFYTFQSMSYTFDVYRRKFEPQRDLIAFFTYVAFFPQMVSGPIERASHLLPQFLHDRKFSYEAGVNGLRQILWGLFKKVVVADNAAVFVDRIFGESNYAHVNPMALTCAAILFAVQIYGDFSGYTDIAIGSAALIGFRLRPNFAFPYFACNLTDFWRRWHISLTSWFRDYVYFPLGGNREGRWRTIRNILVVFIVSGLWHGANWTFIVWGAMHGVLYTVLYLWRPAAVQVAKLTPSLWAERIRSGGGWLFTFTFVCIGWVFFRADSVSRAWTYLRVMLAGWLKPATLDFSILGNFTVLGLTIAVLFGLEGINRHRRHGLDLVWPAWATWPVYWSLLLFVVTFGKVAHKQFIYFQF